MTTDTMQGKKKPIDDDTNFLRAFATLDDSTLISPKHWAALCEQSLDSVYSARARGVLPKPVIEKNRLVRWTAGQYRARVRSLAEAVPEHRRTGRPRKEAQQPVRGAA